jgi:hypothetical protein
MSMLDAKCHQPATDAKGDQNPKHRKGVFVPADLETMTGVEATAGSRRKRIAPSVLVLQLRLVCLAAACMSGALFLLGRAMASSQKQKQR